MPCSVEEKTGDRFLSSAGVALLLIALVYACWMMSHVMSGPFQRGFLGLNGARYSLMARNVLRCDLAAARFAPLVNAEDEEEPDPYLHHPPLLHWVIALVFHVFGETENHARMVPFIFTLLNLILLYILGRRVIGGRFAGGLCALIAAALPMTSYYGAHIDVQGAPLVFCMLACVISYLQWMKSSGKGWLALSLACLFVGTLFDWPALYLSLLLPLHHWISLRCSGRTFKDTLRKTWPYPVVGISLFAVLVFWLALAGTSKGTTLWDSLVVRTFKPEPYIDVDDRWKFAWNTIKDYCLPGIHGLYPWPFLGLIFLGWLVRGWWPGREGSRLLKSTLWLFFLLGLIHMVLFPFGILFHDYWTFLFVPWVSLAGALCLVRITLLCRDRLNNRIAGYALTLAVLAAASSSGHLFSMKRFARSNDQVAYKLGEYIHEIVPPGDAVITNALNCNPPDWEAEGDRYLFMPPTVTYYADRVVRGDVKTPDQFEKVLKRRDDFRYFVFHLGFRSTHGALLQYLEARYPVEEKIKGALIFFRLE